MAYMSVAPAYGRDYKSAKAVKEDWAAGLDFIITDMGQWEGKYINKPQVPSGTHIMVRYANKAKVVQVC